MKKYLIMRKYLTNCLILLALFLQCSIAGAVKIEDLTEDTSPTSDDYMVTVNNPGGTPASRKVTLGNLIGSLGTFDVFAFPSNATPTTDTSGECALDTNAWATGRGALQCYDGTASTYLVGALASDIPADGQVVTWHTGGTLTFDTPLTAPTGTDTRCAFFDGTAIGDDAGCTYNKTTDTLTVGAVQTSATTTPSSDYRDSDATDGDINTQILTNCTATGSGTENCDMTLKQQISGTLTAWLTADADSNIDFSRSISLGTAGVKLSGDGDGAITFLGLGNGSDEDLTINLDDNTNSVAFSSSTGVNFIDFESGAFQMGFGPYVEIYGSGGQMSIFNTAASGSSTGGVMDMIEDDGAAMASGDRLGVFSFDGAEDNAHTTATGSSISSFATGNWSSSSHPTDMRFSTVPSGSITKVVRLTIGSDGNVIVTPPATETIAGGAIITADACGTIKQIQSTGAQTTNTTNTFTNSTTAGCCMDVINVDSADAITLDDNANFNTTGDIILGIADTARVCSDGSKWYLVSTSNN